MNALESLKKYQEGLDELHTYFDEKFYGAPDISTQYYWKFSPSPFPNGEYIRFQDEPIGEDQDEEHIMYSEQCRLVCEKKDLTLFKIHSSTGDHFYAIYDNSKRLK